MITPDKKTKKKNIITALAILAFMVFLFVFTLYKVNTNKNIINAMMVNAVKTFFFLVFLSGVIIKFYLLKKEQILGINIKLNIQI